MSELQGLLKMVDWTRAMAAPRCAGGHEDVLRVLFHDATVLADVSTGDYRGGVGFAYRLADGRVVIVSDYYGSCFGCDAWVDATDDEARKMIHDLATNAHAFPTLADAIEWLRGEAQTDAAYYDAREVAPLLLAELTKINGVN